MLLVRCSVVHCGELEVGVDDRPSGIGGLRFFESPVQRFSGSVFVSLDGSGLQVRPFHSSDDRARAFRPFSFVLQGFASPFIPSFVSFVRIIPAVFVLLVFQWALIILCRSKSWIRSVFESFSAFFGRFPVLSPDSATRWESVPKGEVAVSPAPWQRESKQAPVTHAVT